MNVVFTNYNKLHFIFLQLQQKSKNPWILKTPRSMMSCFCLPPLNVTKLFIYVILVNSQWQMQDNLDGDANAKGWGEAPTYYLTKICQELHENEDNWTRGVRPIFFYVDPPLILVTISNLLAGNRRECLVNRF